MTEAVNFRSADELIKLALALGKVQGNPHPGGKQFVLVPKPEGGAEIVYLDRPDYPSRRSGMVQTLDIESFITATKRYYDPTKAVIYAMIDPGSFVAVLNDHHADGADWRDHRVEFPLSFSKEYLTWTKQNKQPMAQEEFAFFIEDNMPDFIEPSGARMLEIAINFRVKQGVRFSSGIRLQDGTVNLEYVEQNTAGAGKTGKFTIPEKFKIEIPVWSGLEQKGYEFEAFLRWKLTDGNLAIRYELQRPHKVVEAAFSDTLQEIRNNLTGATILFGKP